MNDKFHFYSELFSALAMLVFLFFFMFKLLPGTGVYQDNYEYTVVECRKGTPENQVCVRAVYTRGSQ